MSAPPSTVSQTAPPQASRLARSRFGATVDGESEAAAVHWVLKRNCSITPSQMLVAYAGLCSLSLSVAVFFWAQGARMVMPFAWVELLAVGAAMLVYARHAGDRERIDWQSGRLAVELIDGGQVQKASFAQGSVWIEPLQGDGSLIELCGRGGTICVGRYVRPELRPALAEELRSVLRGRWSAATPETV